MSDIMAVCLGHPEGQFFSNRCANHSCGLVFSDVA